jgi:hypothetical protein
MRRVAFGRDKPDNIGSRFFTTSNSDPRMRKSILLSGSALLVLGAAVLTGSATPAFAQERDHWHGGEGHWHGDIYHFRDYDFGAWRGGHWFQGPHDGRGGWWWIVGGIWYYYPAPVYPYPDPYTPPGVTAIAGAPGAYVYYCGNPAGYYPYVPQCYAPWQAVASTAPAPAMAPPPAMAAPPMSAPPTGAPPMADQHEMDNRQLKDLGSAFAQIDPMDPAARTKLKKLEARVDAFHQSLYDRQYNAMELLRDSEKLEKRVAAERAKIPAHPPAAPPPP